MTRPSDRAIAQAFYEFQEATTAVPIGHYDDTKGSSTYNWRRSFESAVLARATELDATAAPVVVVEVTDDMICRFANVYYGRGKTHGHDRIRAALTAALAGD